MKDSPLFVAIANAVFPGIGYIILQKRIVFGWLLLSATIIGNIWEFLPSTQGASVVWGYNPLTTGLSISGFALMSVAFAYDAYKLAKER